MLGTISAHSLIFPLRLTLHRLPLRLLTRPVLVRHSTFVFRVRTPLNSIIPLLSSVRPVAQPSVANPPPIGARRSAIYQRRSRRRKYEFGSSPFTSRANISDKDAPVARRTRGGAD